ncbi:filamin-A-like isoform X2 [Drosophila innubila]|uniref:filamin-A-like isoform X2 n=1 Tax=Drosophila innubila TaxID=198719 RepID=UPI00148E0D63|nr:filamin-A-like isoform X2 [Drosophila innubila]
MDAERARIAGDAPWKKIQQNTFTRWANEHLKTANSSIENLGTDFSDGLRLIALVEVLSQKHIPKHNKNPTFRTQKLENVSIALKFLQGEEGIKIVNIDSSDIVDGKLKLIMGLVWTLIIHYSISMPKWDGEDDQIISGATPKQRLLNWIQSKLPDMPIKNFTHDWTTGKPVGALVDACAPGLCPDWELWDPNDAVANATEAMTLADDWLDVRQLIKPEELVDPNVDEQSVMTYLSQYPNAKLKEGAPLRPKSDPNSPPSVDGVRAYGPGIEPDGVVMGTNVKFTVETLAVGQGVVDVDIEDVNGDIEQAYVEFNNDMNLTYTISYMPKLEGLHKVIVRYSGIEIPNSPFYVPVERPAEDCLKLKNCYDDYLDLPIVKNTAQIDHLFEGMSFTFIGQVGLKCDVFSINFVYPNEAEDIALHINPRLSREFIVRNTRLNKVWGPEEVTTPTSFTLSRGSRFKIQVVVNSDCYLILINNQPFAQYKHRLPFEDVRILRVDGDVELYQIYRTIVNGYPSRFPHFGPSVGDLYELPLVKSCVAIDELFEGYSFIFCGRIASNCNEFSINFVYDNEKRDIALHVVTRLEQKSIVRNTKLNDVWVREEAFTELPFLLRRGGTFTIQVLVTAACYLISINGHHLAQFTHRLSYGAVRFLEVLGEVENVQIYRTMVYGYPVPIMPTGRQRCIEEETEEDI